MSFPHVLTLFGNVMTNRYVTRIVPVLKPERVLNRLKPAYYGVTGESPSPSGQTDTDCINIITLHRIAEQGLF